jgi:fibronectin type 3 domain-containing protein
LTSTQSSSPYDDTSADPGTTYHYWVKACNSNGCSDYSSDDTGYRALTAPTSVAASDGTYTDKVSVTWNASSGATQYEVYRNTSNSHTGETLLTSTQSSSPYDDTSADPGETYYYWVKACNVNGCSDYSSFDTGYRSLTAPTGVAASDGTYTDRVTVAWNASTGATYYQVFRNTINSHDGEVQLVGDPLNSPFEDITAVPGVDYYYWVKACNADYCSDYSVVDLGWREIEPVYSIFLPLIISD